MATSAATAASHWLPPPPPPARHRHSRVQIEMLRAWVESWVGPLPPACSFRDGLASGARLARLVHTLPAPTGAGTGVAKLKPQRRRPSRSRGGGRAVRPAAGRRGAAHCHANAVAFLTALRHDFLLPHSAICTASDVCSLGPPPAGAAALLMTARPTASHRAGSGPAAGPAAVTGWPAVLDTLQALRNVVGAWGPHAPRPDNENHDAANGNGGSATVDEHRDGRSNPKEEEEKEEESAASAAVVVGPAAEVMMAGPALAPCEVVGGGAPAAAAADACVGGGDGAPGPRSSGTVVAVEETNEDRGVSKAGEWVLVPGDSNILAAADISPQTVKHVAGASAASTEYAADNADAAAAVTTAVTATSPPPPPPPPSSTAAAAKAGAPPAAVPLPENGEGGLEGVMLVTNFYHSG